MIGHLGVGFAAKKLAPRTSPGWLIAAPLLLDLLWPVFLLLGWEAVRIDPEATVVTPLDSVSYPISHSLAAAAGWALLMAGVYWKRAKYRAGALAAGVGLWIFVAFLLLVYTANLLGPPPERMEQIAYVALSMWLFPLWAWSFDRCRSMAVPSS